MIKFIWFLDVGFNVFLRVICLFIIEDKDIIMVDIFKYCSIVLM